MTTTALVQQTYGQRLLAAARRDIHSPNGLNSVAQVMREIAREHGVQASNVYRTRALLRGDWAEVVAALERNTISADTAFRLAKFPKAQALEKLSYLVSHPGPAAVRTVFGMNKGGGLRIKGVRVSDMPNPPEPRQKESGRRQQPAFSALCDRALDQIETAYDAIEESLRKTPTLDATQAHTWIAAMLKRRAQGRRITNLLRTKGGCVSDPHTGPQGEV